MHVFTSQNSAPHSIAVSAHKSQGKYHLFVLLLLYCRLLASLIFRPQWEKALTLMEFALKSIILCGTFGLKTDSIKCF